MAEPQAAACPKCGKTIRLKKDGTFWHHQWRSRFDTYDGRSPMCEASGQPPASTNPEEN